MLQPVVAIVCIKVTTPVEPVPHVILAEFAVVEFIVPPVTDHSLVTPEPDVEYVSVLLWQIDVLPDMPEVGNGLIVATADALTLLSQLVVYNECCRCSKSWRYKSTAIGLKWNSSRWCAVPFVILPCLSTAC
ncbi:MAG: hypothetical protein HW421_3672 [Ignavibacteria bacterium]|nr:hypothetical protein [Ignavibacteria bacterium]